MSADPASDGGPPERERPIGVFDSGVGGLTVVAALRRRLPHEEIVYLGDTARLPYGTKSKETVARYSQRTLDFLVARGVKAVVVACNTASALALDRVRVDVPLIGVLEPGARAASDACARGPIGVLATESTVRSGAYEEAIAAHRPGLDVISCACPLFVPLVEEGWADDPIAVEIARRYLEPLLACRVDTLLLGCTHYPALRATLRSVTGPNVRLVDSAETVAVQIEDDLASRGLLRPPRAGAGAPPIHLHVTDAAERFGRIAHELLRSGGALSAVAPPPSLALVDV
ncbi:MAG: glutamate racemase [Acidobacteriota bacterium]